MSIKQGGGRAAGWFALIGVLLMLTAAGGYLLTRPDAAEEEPSGRQPGAPGWLPPQEQPVTSLEPEPQPPPETPEETPEIFLRDGVHFLRIEGTEILLASKVYALPEDYGGEHPDAKAALERMIAAAAADGEELFVVSGFRDYETQTVIYDRYVAQWGQEYTDTVAARPGHSEHQTGMTYDINALETAFRDTPEYAWLIAHCAEYGFILRYPDGSEWATGYAYEPWHYRYIGDAALAGRIMESGLSLEEYAGMVTGPGESGYRD